MIEIAGKDEFWILTSAGLAPFGVTGSKEDADMIVNLTKRSNDPDSIRVIRHSKHELVLNDLSMKRHALGIIEAYLQAGPMTLADFKQITKDL